MCVQMLMYAIAHRGCTNIVRESAVKVESGRKIPCHTGRIEPPVLPVVFGLKKPGSCSLECGPGVTRK